MRSTTEEFIKKAILVHGNKFGYELVEYINVYENIQIICNKHEKPLIFKQRPKYHLMGRGCPECNPKKKSNISEFILKAEKVHGNKFDYSKSTYVNKETKLIIICSQGHEFLQTPHSHLSGAGCYYCNGGIKDTIYNFLYKAKLIHGDKFIYDKVEYINSSTKVILQCKNGHEFLQLPSSHLQKQGCPKCVGKNKTTEEFIEQANKIHNYKFIYDKTIYISINQEINIKCKIHNYYFLQFPNLHLKNKGGCPKCNFRSKMTTESFIKKSKLIHGDKFIYYKVEYINSNTKVILQCKNGHEFLQTPNKHIQGRGCSKCSNNISKPEIEWLNQIEQNHGLKIIRQYKIPGTRYKADGFIPETHTILEMDGDFYHGNPDIFDPNEYNSKCKKTYGELYQKTLKKREKIKSLGYNLVSIWYSDYIKSKG